MTLSFETLQTSIDQLARQAMGENAGPKTLRKFRLFLGILGIIAANVWLGSVIGHGLAAILGTAFFFVVGLGGRDLQKEDEQC